VSPQDLLVVPVVLYLMRVASLHLLSRMYLASREAGAPPGDLPSVSLIRPLRGDDPYALENHRSLFEQTYPGKYEILFCAEDPHDPALEVVRSLQSRYPDVQMRIVQSGVVDAVGLMKNIIAGVESARHEVIVFSDSDVCLPPRFLQGAVAALADPRVGLAFCVPLVEGAQDWVAAMFASAVNETAVTIAALARVGAYGEAVGATMAIRRDVIDEIGGLEQFRRRITHDVPLARAVRRRSYRVHVLREAARIRHGHDRFGRAYAHLLRWLVIIRSYHPVLFLLAPLDLPVYWSLLYLATRTSAAGTAASLVLVILAMVARPVSIAVTEPRWSGRRPPSRFFGARCLHEWLRLPLLVQAMVTREIEWRGRRFRLGRGGRVQSVVEVS
jgi:ceramide glucosyltransferase